MKAIFIMCDTLSRRVLSAYHGADPAFTPNIDRLVRRGMVFDRHFVGSAPCMPARRDMLTGRLNFLEKPWGGMEPFDFSMPRLLAVHGNVHSMMFSDHSHYLIPGGEDYTKGFTAFQVFRGQEGDPVWVRPDQNGIREERRPEGFKGVYTEAEAENRAHFQNEEDYPSVQTLHSAAKWLEENHEADNFLLWAETFDPHEPYDAPRHYLDLYERPGEYDGWDFTHPSYQENEFDEAETAHLMRRYKALITMTDRHIGELLDVMDSRDLWKDTLLIFTTDHGYHLGEHGFMAKNYMPPYNEVFHIPMIVCHPEITHPGRCEALTQNIDVLPTILEFFGVPEDVIPYPLHGRSLFPLLRGEADSIRRDAIFGYFGKQVGYTDGRYTYFRAAKDQANRPLYLYCSTPTLLRQMLGADDGVKTADYDRIECGRFLSWTNYPAYRFPADIIHFDNLSQEFERRSPYNSESLLFDLENDYAQDQPVRDEALERTICQQLRNCMALHDAPAEQYERLGL